MFNFRFDRVVTQIVFAAYAITRLYMRVQPSVAILKLTLERIPQPRPSWCVAVFWTAECGKKTNGNPVFTDLIIRLQIILDTASGYPHDVVRASCCLPPVRS